MKQEITPRNNLEILAHYIITAYDSAKVKEKGGIQFDLNHLNENILCHFVADGNIMVFNFGEIKNFDVKLTASLYDWLDLANNRLNPIWGVLTRKLKFAGNTKIFDKIIKKELIYKIKADTLDPLTEFEINPIKRWKVPEKILVINGGPRGRNGYTYQYLSRFIKGLHNAGASLQTIELGQKKINPCLGCFHCWKNNTGKCIQKDDVNDLYEMYKDADLIIYAFPLYWDTVPGILKNFIERAFCLEHPYIIPGVHKTRHPRRIKKEQSFFVFSVCGFPEEAHFDSLKKYFSNVSHNAHIPFLGGIYRTACMFLINDPMYYRTYNLVMDSIEKAGASLYQEGKINKNILKVIHAAIDPQEFRSHANKFWENVVLKDEYCAERV